MDHQKLKVLHRNEMGWAARCSCCREIQFQLGNVFLRLAPEEVQAFSRSLQHLQHCCQVRQNLNHEIYRERPYIIRTPIHNLMFSFSEEEYQQVLNLVEMTVLLLTVEKILNHEE